MQLPFTLTQFKRFFAVVGGWYANVAAYVNFNHLPAGYREVLAATGTLVLAVEHLVGNSNVTVSVAKGGNTTTGA